MSTKNTVIGVLAGLAAGVAIGVLLAPRSGKETRELLKKKGKKRREEISELLDRGYERWKQARESVVERAHMTKADIRDFLHFMAAEGADLKDRLANDAKSQRREASATAKRTMDQTINN